MPWGVAAAAAVGAVGSIASGAIGAGAASSAAADQEAASLAATQAQQQMFQQTQQTEQPFISGGTNALTQLQQLLSNGGLSSNNQLLQMLGITTGANGASTNPILQALGYGGTSGGIGAINPSTFQGSPGYQFQLQQGLNAVTNSAAANGGLGGNALKSLQSYGTGLANQDWYNYLSSLSGAYGNLTNTLGTTQQNQISNLQGVATLGQNAAGNLGTNATTTAGQIGSNIIGAGNAAAAGTVGSANAIAGGLNGVSNNAIQYLLANQNNSGNAFSSAYPTGNAYLQSLGYSATPSSGLGSTNQGLGGIY